MPHSGLVTQLPLEKKKEIYVGELDSDIYYHRVELPKQFQPYFGLSPVKFNGKVAWPRYRVVPTGSHSITVAMAITDTFIRREAQLNPAMKVTANAPARVGRC